MFVCNYVGFVPMNGVGETYYGIWNTIPGGDSTPSSPGSGVGNYYPGEEPDMAFDRVDHTIYTNFGSCPYGDSNSACGINTGLYFTPTRGLSSIQSFRFFTASDIPQRDPIIITLECSNASSSLLTQGSSWTLIYNGTSGLDIDPGRYAYGIMQYLSNTLWCLSYRILTTAKRANTDAVQYSELELLGY